MSKRREAEVDLDACANDDERRLAVKIKNCIDAAARGETKMVSMPEAARDVSFAFAVPFPFAGAAPRDARRSR